MSGTINVHEITGRQHMAAVQALIRYINAELAVGHVPCLACGERGQYMQNGRCEPCIKQNAQRLVAP